MKYTLALMCASIIVCIETSLALPDTGHHNRSNARVIRLRSGDVDTSAAVDWPALARDIAARTGHYVIQLDGPMTFGRRNALSTAGVEIVDYLPERAYIVTVSDADADALATLDFIRWAAEFDDSWKIAPNIGGIQFSTPERTALAADGLSKLVITLFPAADVSEFAAAIESVGGRFYDGELVGGRWLVDAQMATPSVASIAALNDVQFVEDAPEGVLRNATNAWILQSNSSNSTPVWDKGITGAGQIIGLIDSTPRKDHCMFVDPDHPVGPDHRKLVAMRNAAQSPDSHGTHVAGTLAGDSSPWDSPNDEDGMAFSAKISFSNYTNVKNDPSTLYARFVDAYNDGARVHSNSWGDDGSNDYTTWCQQIDQFTWDYENNLVAFAVSNGSKITTPENAKNCLAVAGVKDAPNQDQPCSGGNGPTKDGRRKPEIMAPSCSIRSADVSTKCGTRSSSGTSMAAPAIAGAATLVRQYFTDGFYPSGQANPTDGFEPTGALLRAVLLNASQDVSGIDGYPSNKEGWGRLLLDAGLYFGGDSRRLIAEDIRNADGMSTDDAYEFVFSVVDLSEPLRLTMVFTDPPATVNSTEPVINNLDLSMTTPIGDQYLGNVFSDGRSTGGGDPDLVNTVEQILLTPTELGRHHVRIDATAVNQYAQGFALVISGGTRYQPTAAPGDMNCDGDVNFNDIDGFVGALSSFSSYLADYPTCDPYLADLNDDGNIDYLDIDPFIDALIR